MRKAGDAPAARPFLVGTDAGPGSGRSGAGTGGGLRAGGAPGAECVPGGVSRNAGPAP